MASIIEIVIMLAAALLSFKTTSKKVRKANNFTWGAIEEVAILFIGIFITMIPALLILKARGSELGLTHPAQFFWMTGLLSSFLDNTPTYLVFFTTAASSGFTEGISTAMGIVPQVMLMAKNGVDGVYSDDPRVNKNAKKYDKITYDDIIVKGLKVMDTASCALCKQNHIPIIVFDFAAKGSIARLLSGETLGTFVGE